MSTFTTYSGDGFTDYQISDAHGPRGTIRLECDGAIQMTPASEHIGTGEDANVASIGTIWVGPEDGQAYRDILAHLQKFANKLPSQQIETAAG